MSKEKKETTKLDASQKAMIDIAKFRETLKDKTEEELLKLEQDIIAETDKHNEARNKKTFALPSKNYKEAAEAIRMALDTMTVQWQYALVLKALYDFFDPEKKAAEIEYPMLDSLLRQLTNANLQGHEQWGAVIVISDYFEPIREAYAEAAAEIYVDAEKHNCIVNQLQLFKAQGEVVDAAPLEVK